MKPERRDVTKSKQAIKNAFLRLSLLHPINKITIQDVLQEANISRGTFYSYFQDIYDLQETVENEILMQWTHALSSCDLKQLTTDPYPVILNLLRFFKNLINTNDSLCQSSLNPLFFHRLKSMLKQFLMEQHDSAIPNDLKHTTTLCVAGIIVDACYDLMRAPSYFSTNKPEITARYISSFIAGGIQKVRSESL